ncbi:TPA: hypothetical protein UM690_000104 [Stenotrophomonas maltophilia]|nr:hypothetical protein [Stenotrophomonas maltophilia]HEL4287448.1 hypothetical protein [Stenotrophomonas maltophilia]
MNTTMADGAEQRLDAQIAEALFGQPGMSKMDVANRVRELRGDGPALLVDGQTAPEGQIDAETLWWLQDAINTMAEGGNQSHVQFLQRLHDALSAQPHPGGHRELVTDAMVYAAEQAYANSKPDNLHESFRDAIAAALSAQTSPGGQGARALLAAQYEAAGSDKRGALIREGRDHAPSTSYALRAIEAALATRQPVGQKPVAWMTHHDEPLLYPTFQEAAAYCDDDEPPIPLYAAPPAQAVDLGQFRNAVAWAYHALGNVSYRGPLGELLALIGGKAAGNG